MPTRRTGRSLLNPQGRKAWSDDGPTGGRDLWEIHGVWEWDGAGNSGVVLADKYFVNDPVTGRKVIIRSIPGRVSVTDGWHRLIGIRISIIRF